MSGRHIFARRPIDEFRDRARNSLNHPRLEAQAHGSLFREKNEAPPFNDSEIEALAPSISGRFHLSFIIDPR